MAIIQGNLSDLYQTALIRIGNYLAVDEISATEFTLNTFQTLFVNQIYPLYTKYVYKRAYQTVWVTFSLPYTFAQPAPAMVNRVLPVGFYGLYMGAFMSFRYMSNAGYFSSKPMNRFTMVWRYEAPNLYVGYEGYVELELSYKLVYNQNTNILDIDEDTQDILQDLCSSYMMISLGRSRRMVKVADSNLDFDAEGMVTEGEELLKETRTRLIDLASIDAVNY